MILRIFVYLIVIGHSVVCLGMNNELPAHIQTVLDEHSAELRNLLNECNVRKEARMGTNVSQKEWLPGYYIKYGIERFSNAQKLRRVIDKHNLDLISVPEKYLYHVPGTPKDLSSSNYLIIVKNVSGKRGQGQCLNVHQVHQLYKVATLAGHYDLHPANYITTTEGKVIIIDTDSHAMPFLEKIKLLKHDWLLNGNRIHNGGGICMNPEIINDPLVKLELPMYSKWENYDALAYQYLANLLKKREKLRLNLQKRLNLG